MIFLISLISAFAIFMFVISAYIFYKRKKSIDIFHRLRRHVGEVKETKKTDDTIYTLYKILKRWAKPLDSFNFVKQLEFKLKQAGLPLFGGEAIILATILGTVVAFVFYIITFNLELAPFIGLSVPFALFIWVKILIKRRRKAFTEQLGDCLTTVANALRAGYSFQQAMDVVAREMEPPISTEFERVATDVAMGVPLETALEQMNERIGSADFDLVVTAVLIQREIGGNLAQILDTISTTINERIRMKREIQALTAQGRFSAMVLLVLPFIVAAFCWIFNHDQMQVFVDDPSGRIAIIVAFVMEILGFIIIQKIVDIEM
ncbi:MAG: type II secretion system F family protein [Selenomonadaceae bacterium]|nr:type II secretion system F family protein [Selenomonadaceae bacterium]